MAQHLSKDEIRELFNHFDNGNGVLSLAEVERAVIHWYPQFGTNRAAMLRAFKAADSNGSGFIELREFRRLINLLYYYNELSRDFAELDTNGDKRISFQEFCKGHEMMTHHDSNNIAQLRREFDAIDTNRGGYILFDEFCIYMAKKKSN